jgi:RNA polymerase sigma factor (sigma-70 family)
MAQENNSYENNDIPALTPPTKLDEASLARENWTIHQVRQGDKDAVITLYESQIDWVYSLVYSQVGNIAEAEALTTEVFTQAIEAIMNGQYTPQGKPFSSYLSAIVNDVLQERKRRLHNLPGIKHMSNLLGAIESDAQKASSPNTPAQKEEQAALWNLVKKLPVDEQQVLIMQHVYGLPYSEIARRLKRSERASRHLYYRALTNLKHMVHEID